MQIPGTQHSGGRGQKVFFRTNGRMLPFPDRSQHGRTLLAKKKLDDWEIIEKIQKSFQGADDWSLGHILKTMIDSAEVKLEQIESAYTILLFYANSLKAGLADYIESEARSDFGKFLKPTDR